MKSFERWVSEMSSKIDDKDINLPKINRKNLVGTGDFKKWAEQNNVDVEKLSINYSVNKKEITTDRPSTENRETKEGDNLNFWQRKVADFYFINHPTPVRYTLFGSVVPFEKMTNLHCWKYLEACNWKGCDDRPTQIEIAYEVERLYETVGYIGTFSDREYLDVCKLHNIYG